MSRETIPQKTIIRCDRCQVVCDNRNRKTCGSIKIFRYGLDFSGMAAGYSNMDMDFCDICMDEIVRCITICIK